MLREMVSLIPRLSSFAVSGTPARSQISDMIHVLRYLFSSVHHMHTYTPTHYRFLRVTDVTDPWRVWARLLKQVMFVNLPSCSIGFQLGTIIAKSNMNYY